MYPGRIVLAVLFSVWLSGAAFAQQPQNANVVATCGTPNSTYGANTNKPVTQDTTGATCIAGTISATATTTATASATPTTVTAGTGRALNINLSSGLFVQPTFGGTPVDGSNGLPVNCILGCSGGPADEAAFTAGTSSIITGGFYQTTATANALTNGQQGSVQMTAQRAFFINLRNASGAEIGVAAAPVQVSVANTGANATAIKAEGSGTAGSAGTGVMSVQGIASMTPVQVSQATASNLNATVSQATAANLNATVNVSQVGGGAVPSLGTGIMAVAVKPTATAAAGITPVVSSAFESSHVLKAGAGNLYSVYVTTSTSAGFLMVFDATSAPADGAVTPKHCVPAPAAGFGSVSAGMGPPDVFATGITAVFSTASDCFTKTASATAFFSGSVQ